MSEICAFANQKSYPFVLPELPYADSALEPHMSAKTFGYHHKKHHNAYVANLNKLLENNELNSKSLEEIIQSTHKDPSKIGIFNNAAQVWNHSFFWHSMKPQGGGKPHGEILKKINDDFGSFESFVSEFKTAAKNGCVFPNPWKLVMSSLCWFLQTYKITLKAAIPESAYAVVCKELCGRGGLYRTPTGAWD